MGRYEEAVTECQKAVELEPDNVSYHETFGWMLKAMGRHDEAEAEFQKAAELKSK